MHVQATLFDEPTYEPDLSIYDRFIVMTSGGKDSLSCLLTLLDRGVSRDRIILYHQRIDGEPEAEPFYDWPCTDRYVALIGQHFGIPLHWQWRKGGFRAELYRENTISQPVEFLHGQLHDVIPVEHAQPNTRRKFPALSTNLAIRWCSSALKTDVAARAITHDPELQGTLEKPKAILVLSGERREESVARSRYAGFERHRTWSRRRPVDLWRAVLEWPEEKVWAIIRRYRLLPHPAYLLGYSRCSCMACIFSSPDHWAMMQALAPDRFERVAQAEQEIGFTIRKGETICEQAKRGTLDRMPKDWEQYRLWAFEPNSLTSIEWDWSDGWYPAGAFHGSEGGNL